MDVSELKVFIAAAEELNFSRAAHRLHISQSAVSQNIQAMERAYGVELFLRHGRSVQLSEVGQSLLPKARDVLTAMRLLEDLLANIQGEVGGELTIGCSTTSGKYLLPSLLAAFRQQYPLVRTRISVSSRVSVIERLLEQNLALGVVSRKVEHRDLEYMPLFEDQIILIVPSTHPWGKTGHAIPADLVDQPFIRREDSSSTYQASMEAIQPHGITPDMLNNIMELANAEAIEMAVEQGIGIAFVSELVAARGLALGKLKRVEVAGVSITQNVYLCRQVAAAFTCAEARFWEFIQQNSHRLSSEMLINLGNITPTA